MGYNVNREQVDMGHKLAREQVDIGQVAHGQVVTFSYALLK